VIISHKYKFIFIKPEKTAGSSLEIALSKYCDQNDIITTIGEEYIRKKHGYLGPRNYYSNNIDYVNFSKILKHNTKSFIKTFKIIKKFIDYKNEPYFKTFYKNIFYEHINASNIKANVSSKIWDNYFKFTIIRNPVDQFLSYYFHINNSLELIKQNPINYFIDAKAASFFRRTKNKYFINDNIIIDKFINFSQFKSDINFIGKKLMINDDLFKDFKNISANTQYSNKSNLNIDNNTRKIIQDYSADLFQLYLNISKK